MEKSSSIIVIRHKDDRNFKMKVFRDDGWYALQIGDHIKFRAERWEIIAMTSNSVTIQNMGGSNEKRA